MNVARPQWSLLALYRWDTKVTVIIMLRHSGHTTTPRANQILVCLNQQLNGILQILTRFIQRAPLGIRTRQLLHIANPPSISALKNGGKLHHSTPLSIEKLKVPQIVA